MIFAVHLSRLVIASASRGLRNAGIRQETQPRRSKTRVVFCLAPICSTLHCPTLARACMIHGLEYRGPRGDFFTRPEDVRCAVCGQEKREREREMDEVLCGLRMY